MKLELGGNMEMPKTAQCFDAPAKLNLFLHITGQREDGYHLLETQFQLIDLCDKIYLQSREDGRIVLHAPTFGRDQEQDLTVKAATLLKKYTNTTKGADIWYEKNIPIGAGLGGGSSDAATTLMGLNHLWQTKVHKDRLQQLSLRIGADVPFFVFGRNAFASGVGEKFIEVNQPIKWYVVVYPKIHISTKEIFSDKRLTRNTPSIKIRSLDVGAIRKNDMQDVVVNKYPEVAEALNELNQFGYSIMTGSGSCVFLTCDSKVEAEKVFQVISNKFEAYCVQGLAQHMLLDL